MLKRIELPYQPDSSRLFACVSSSPWAVFLDSTFPWSRAGRYDIVAAEPYVTLQYHNGKTEVTDATGSRILAQNPFAVLRSQLGEPVSNHSGLPFCGGAIGCFCYDLGRNIETLPDQTAHDILLPELNCGIYDWAVVVDHHLRRTHLVSTFRDPATRDIWETLPMRFTQPDTSALATPANFRTLSAPQTNLDREAYEAVFRQVQAYIHAGDCYQVNLAQRFGFAVQGDPWIAYTQLRQYNPAPYSAFLRLPQANILSNSPECFLRLRNGLVETQPIKGTRPRSVFPYEDESLAQALRESEKDRAENLMIVDLLRNDLARSCLPGSVSVPSLFALESFASVHHLVSTVRGRLAPGKDAIALLQGCFPGGSITGAPKLRAMQIIEELEPHRRSVYCGAIGYIGFDGNMDTNIAIRTLLHCQDRMYCWAGGGITHGSQAAEEYQECFDKVDRILRFLNGGEHAGH